MEPLSTEGHESALEDIVRTARQLLDQSRNEAHPQLRQTKARPEPPACDVQAPGVGTAIRHVAWDGLPSPFACDRYGLPGVEELQDVFAKAATIST